MGNLIDDVWFSTELPPAQPNKGHLTVTKEITGVAPNTSLSDYSVTVTVGEDSKTISSFTYDPQLECYVGTASFPNLTPGSYSVTETVNGTIEGYEADSAGSTTSQNVTVVANQTAAATLINNYELDVKDYEFTKKWEGTPTSFVVTLKDSKYDDLTVSVANDGTATVTGGSYTATVSGATGKTWTITVEDVPADSDYYVSAETSVGGENVTNHNGVLATSGYNGTTNGASWWQVSISGNTITNTHYSVVRNDPKGILKIYKTDESNKPLNGVTFSLTGKDSQTTKDGGYAMWTDLAVDEYTLAETAPEGYVQPGSWIVKVEKTPDIAPKTTTATNGSKTITYNDTVAVKVKKSTEADTAYQTVSDAYTITNSKVKASLTITKSVAGSANWDSEGYTFTITGPNYNKTVTLTSNKQSETLTGLLVGKYTITETNPGNSGDYKWDGVSYSGTGVSSSGSSATVTIDRDDHGKTITVNAANNYSKLTDGQLQITKNAVGAPNGASFDFTVKIDGQPYQGNYKIGSEKKKTDDGKITLTGGQTATISGLTRGASYEVVEDDYTTGYDTTVKIGTGTATNSRTASGTISGTTSEVTYTNTYVTQSVTFTKADAAEGHSPLSGAKFILKDSNDNQVGEEVTSDNGAVTFAGVPVGVYSLWETEAPEGYVDVPTNGKDLGITVTVAKTGVTFSKTSKGIGASIASFFSGGNDDPFEIVGGALTVYNTHKTANIQVTKNVTGGYTPSSGETFTFGLFTQEGDKYEAVTDNSGEAVTIEVAKDGTGTFTGLTTGQTYYVAELDENRTNYDWTVKYNVSAERIKTANGVTYVEVVLDADSTETVKLTATNAYTRKTGDLTVEKTVTDTTTDEDFTIVVTLGDGTGEKVTVTGATAEYQANGVYTFTLSHDESATITGVPYATEYTVEETKTEPFSYVVSGEVTTPAEFLGDHTVTVTNAYVTSGFVVNKVDDKGNLITTSSATFTLYNADPKGAGFAPGAAVVASATTANGVATFSNLAAGTYYLQETTAPNGYAKDETVWTVNVTTSGGKVSKEQVQVTVKENTTLAAQLWNSVLGFFSGKNYSISEALPVTISTADNYKERTAVLKMVNVPQVTEIKKYVATTLYTTGSDPSGYAWADDKAEFENLLPETETVTVLYKVVVTGAPGADYNVTDTLKDTTKASYTVTLIQGTEEGEIPESGSVELYYTAKLAPTTSRKIYTNTASNGTMSDDAKVYLKKQTYPWLKVTIRYWFQNEYGVYELSNYKYDSQHDRNRYLKLPTSSLIVADRNPLAPSPDGYELSKKVLASPAQITYAEAYEEYKAKGTTQWYMDIYYDLKNPTATVQAYKGWSHSYLTEDDQRISSPFQSQMKNVTYGLQRTTTPEVEASWKTYKTSTFEVSTTGSSSTSWFNVELYETGTANKYSYRVVETHINGTELTDENRVLGYAPKESNVLVNDGNGLTEKKTYYVTIQNEYKPVLQPVQDGTKASFTVVKLDENGELLENAKFTLTDASGAAVGEPKTSGTDGRITFDGLTDGTYTLKETDAPTNYKKSTSEWTIVVAKDELVYGAPDQDNHVTVTQNYSIEEIRGSKDQETTKDYAISGSTITVSDERLTTPDNAGLTITKTVTGDKGVTIPTNDPFTFTVVSTGGNYKLNGETVGAGSKTITLTKENATVTLTNIEYGTTFTITETIDDGYTLESVKLDNEVKKNGLNVIIDETTTQAAVTFTNHYVTKGFTIVKEDAEKHLYLSGAKFTVYEYANDEKGDVVLTTEPTAFNVETLAQETSVSNLPVGTYWMEETTAPENYVLSGEAWIITVTKDGITVEKAEPSIGEQAIQLFTGSNLLKDGKLTVNNTPAEYKLTITKNVTGIPARDMETFAHTYNFNLFRGENFAEKLTTEPITVTVTYDEASGKITGSTTITSKEYSWLKADEYLILEDTSTANTETYKLTADSVTSTEVTLTEDQTQAVIEATAELTNDYDRMLGALNITKALGGETDNEKLRDEVDDKEYTFVITAPSDEVMDYGTGTYTTSTSDGTTTTADTITFQHNEEDNVYTATVTAKIGETVTIPGLPTGTYTVTEDRTSADVEYWELAVTGEGSVDVTNNGTAEITVTNTYTREVPPVNPPEDQLTTLTITKMVKDSRGGDLTALAAGKNYYFQITGEDVYGDAPLTKNVTVTGAGSVDVDLIWGDYEVTEVDANGKPIDADSAAVIDGYQWNKVEYTGNEDIELLDEGVTATATATNIYEPVPMGIPVVKTWSGDYSSLPNNIEVALYADGADTGLRLTLDSSDRMDATHWLGVFESTDEHPLYRYADGGKEIVYSVVETEMNGNSITGSSIGYWDITTGRTTAGAAGVSGYDADTLVLTVRNDYDLPDDDDDDDDDPTPSPSTEPTPSPSTEPTSSPSPSDEVEVPDEDTPLDDLPDEIPEDEVDISDEDTPLSDQPDETDIFEEGVPMGDLPQTGSVGDYTAVDPAHTLGMLALAASLMAAGLLVLIGRRKDEETDED
ncbi:SpaA isopeptide-forming pilin-related protein [Intestinimonas timonensis]|uniref:SpaA isopeptide-forming pilin-related protein n=1 Tax=Intestinimonas timonensis TaxID=1689270 RepID=UPI001030633B|nr:SpaA isopeptide-forming pilin-related protein [Intestinimonas timonensis]